MSQYFFNPLHNPLDNLRIRTFTAAFDSWVVSYLEELEVGHRGLIEVNYHN